MIEYFQNISQGKLIITIDVKNYLAWDLNSLDFRIIKKRSFQILDPVGNKRFTLSPQRAQSSCIKPLLLKTPSRFRCGSWAYVIYHWYMVHISQCLINSGIRSRISNGKCIFRWHAEPQSMQQFRAECGIGFFIQSETILNACIRFRFCMAVCIFELNARASCFFCHLICRLNSQHFWHPPFTIREIPPLFVDFVAPHTYFYFMAFDSMTNAKL